ncbi:hypothetical protein [Mycolicibacterium palauense]|uniref:hypothetical protein n=1 Tax=Mycolicibacterium palauense TaxID=2034511 RepID=UPI000BFEB963|nr:hypothetical protein [Mycolicibacterium palauense]
MAYGYHQHPYSPPPQPERSGADLAASIALLVLTLVAWGLAAFFGIFMVAFLDHCPPTTCSIDGAVTAVGTTLLAAAAIAVTGSVVTIVRLVRRRTGWPVALVTLGLCVLAYLLGGLAYGAAVGA